MLHEGYQGGRVTAIATAQAEKWDKHRNKPIKKEHSTGTTGQAMALIAAPNSDRPTVEWHSPAQFR